MDWKEIIQRIFDVYGHLPKNKLAERLEINKSVISQWTTEKPTLWRHPTWEVLRKVVEDQGVTWDWLLTGKESVQITTPPAEASGEINQELAIKCLVVQELLARAARHFSGDASVKQDREALIACSKHIRELAGILEIAANKDGESHQIA